MIQGTAKGFLERGEKLGINQAVRDAMVEIRRNVQEARSSMKAGRDLFNEPGPNTAVRAVALMDRRNRRLAALLDEPLSTLKNLATFDPEDKQKYQDALEIATAKIQFVKVYLEDSTMAVPDEEEPASSLTPSDTPGINSKKADDPEPLSDAVAAMALGTSSPASESPHPDVAKLPTDSPKLDPDRMDTDDPLGSGAPAPPPAERKLERPQGPIPTRSTLAQSSFSWMLEPDDTRPSSSSSPSSSLSQQQQQHQQPPIFPSKLPSSLSKSGDGSSSSSSSHRKRLSANANRERTAFLFGEVSADERGQAMLPEDIFGLQEIRKPAR